MNPQNIDAWLMVLLHAAEAFFFLTATVLAVAYGPRFFRHLDEAMWRYRATSDALSSVLCQMKGEEFRKDVSSVVFYLKALAKTHTKPEHLR